jgi:ABC-type bacteriocin/lantibiotic exporter with double-glycine peptidase domain
MQLNVPYIRQTGDWDCWHAAIRMIYAYKRRASPNPSPALYQADAGLPGNCASVAAMAKDAGLKPLPTQPVTAAQLEALLKQYGPLWLPLQGKGNHVVVLTGIEVATGKIYINDPAAPTNPGQQANQKERDMRWFNQYFAKSVGMLYLP